MSELKQTELSKRLRDFAEQQSTVIVSAGFALQVAEEIERYYTGMLNWKATAEAKDAWFRAQPEANADAEDAPWWADIEVFKFAERYRALRKMYVILNPFTCEQISGNLLDYRIDQRLLANSPDQKLPWERVIISTIRQSTPTTDAPQAMGSGVDCG